MPNYLTVLKHVWILPTRYKVILSSHCDETRAYGRACQVKHRQYAQCIFHWLINSQQHNRTYTRHVISAFWTVILFTALCILAGLTGLREQIQGATRALLAFAIHSLTPAQAYVSLLGTASLLYRMISPLLITIPLVVCILPTGLPQV